MNKHGLDQYLRRLTPEEEEHLSGIYMDYSAMPVAGYDRGQPCYRFVYDPQTYISTAAKKNILVEYYNFSVIKQDRFEEVPLHVHDWLELNYVYSGSCSLYVNRTDITLSQGQMVLINTDAPHAVSRCEENDILINFLISREYLNAAFFERIGKDNYLSAFFIEAHVCTQQVTVTTQYFLCLRIPYDKLLVRIVHHVIFVDVHGQACSSSCSTEGYLTQTSNLFHRVWRILCRNNVNLVVTSVGHAQSLVFGQLRFQQFLVYRCDNLFHTLNIYVL